MTKKIIVRADGGFNEGLGHITRCIYFIKNFNSSFDVIFCIKQNPEVKEFLTAQYYSVYEINPNISINEEIDYLVSLSSDLLILDVRNKINLFFKRCAEKFNKVLRFDDSDRNISIYSKYYLNYNLYAENIDFDVINKDGKLFLGPKYYILNPSFKEYENYERSFRKRAKNILITMGGSDPKNLTTKIVKSIIKLKDIHLNVVLGKLYEYYGEIESLKNNFKDKISIYKNIDNMPEMMAKNEIIIGTGGNTSFEAAYMGLPGILINQIDLQARNSKNYEEKKIFCDGGLGEAKTEGEILDLVKKLIDSKEIRMNLSENGKNLVSYQGIKSVIEKFIN